MSDARRIGLFGGTFDPVHLGHLLLAQDACEQLQLDELRFVPAFLNPLRTSHQAAPAKHRVAMLEAATGGDARFRVDDREIRRGGASYTVDTVESVAAECPEAVLFLLIGQDTLETLPQWHRIDALRQSVRFAVFCRGDGAPSGTPSSPYTHFLEPRRIDLSATEIRNRIAEGLPVEYHLHASVHAYIQNHHIYQ